MGKFQWKDYERQHVQAVDMCAAAIVAHRVKNIPLKAIHLWPDMYKQFKGWTEKNLKRELQDGEQMEFDGVNIEMGTKQQKTPLLLELWAQRELPKEAKIFAMNSRLKARLN